MHVPYIEYAIFGLILTTSIVITHILAKRRFSRTVEVDNSEPKQAESTALKSIPKSDVLESALPIKLNHWKLEVNGDTKFDIKVEWSDGDSMVFSGQAPAVYEVDQEKGVIPTNTAGIPPEWADDGISYQWNLNDHLWC